jgi:hypothetical protein
MSPPDAQARVMKTIDLGTIAGLHGRRHELHAYCGRCDRWRTLDLGELVARGLGAARLPLRVRCRLCGEAGRLQVRPPMPSRTQSGWIAPPLPAAARTGLATNRPPDAPRCR